NRVGPWAQEKSTGGQAVRKCSIFLSVSVIVVLGLTSGCDKKPGTSPAAPPPAQPGAGTQPVAVTGPWTMDFAQLSPPSTPVAGLLAGQEFKPEKVEFDGDNLVFRTGKESFADKEIRLWLSGDHESFEGLKIEVKPDERFAMNTPHINTGAKK